MRPGVSHSPGLGGRVNREIDRLALGHRRRVAKELAGRGRKREPRQQTSERADLEGVDAGQSVDEEIRSK